MEAIDRQFNSFKPDVYTGWNTDYTDRNSSQFSGPSASPQSPDRQRYKHLFGELQNGIGDHPFKTLANFHNFWPLIHKNGYTFATKYSSKCVTVFLNQTLLSAVFCYRPSANLVNFRPLPPLKKAEVLNGWSLRRTSLCYLKFGQFGSIALSDSKRRSNVAIWKFALEMFLPLCD